MTISEAAKDRQEQWHRVMVHCETGTAGQVDYRVRGRLARKLEITAPLEREFARFQRRELKEPFRASRLFAGEGARAQ